MMNVVRIRGTDYNGEDPTLQGLLLQLYELKERPLCMCTADGVALYIAKVDRRYILKRMPNSGSRHHPTCESYEPPEELSGLGQVQGHAIQEDPEGETTVLKLGFSLTKGATRTAPAPSDTEKDSVKTDGSKLTLRGTLHYLWEQARFNHWSPAMEGKRSWYVIRKYLLEAANNKVTKGMDLADILFVPESWNSEKKEEIRQRWMAKLMASTGQGDKRKLLLLVGEVKDFGTSQYGFKVVINQLLERPFMMNEDINRRLNKRFSTEIALWKEREVPGPLYQSKLIIVATFSVNAAGTPSIEEAALMNVTRNWVPFESTFDALMLDALGESKRRYIKGLRYNMVSTKPMATAVLTDTPVATALYITPPGATDEFVQQLDQLKAESNLEAWCWDAGTEGMPALPSASTGK